MEPDQELVLETCEGVLKALRVILRCKEGESILGRATTVQRRCDNSEDLISAQRKQLMNLEIELFQKTK